MRRLIHLMLSPSCRLARLMVAEKRVACDPVLAEDARHSMPVFIDLDGTRCEGVWAILDHLEGHYPEHPLAPEEAGERRLCLRWLDWAMGPFHESVTQRVVYEKAGQRYTGAPAKRAPDMNVIRQGREELKLALKAVGEAVELNGNLAGRLPSLGDLAMAAHLSTLDYFGEVPWEGFPSVEEWYLRLKSRPSFRSILADRVPGQPPVAHYAELDF
ncbi:MAG TPA: glutathione S-transferase family protein [Rhizomicrobium sp.]|nr:glutathione S-transferase family protein [Rhizomicrobium sp.]HWC62459.1 glutathione S-transferase family protein [Rhizomicrobium sp.]